MEIKGWEFKTNAEVILITDDKGNNHIDTSTRSGKAMIEKKGSSRILRYPKFVIDFVSDHFGQEVINNSK